MPQWSNAPHVKTRTIPRHVSCDIEVQDAARNDRCADKCYALRPATDARLRWIARVDDAEIEELPQDS